MKNELDTIASLEHLQKQALEILEKFPNKVADLNNIIEIYEPVSIKSNTNDTQLVNKLCGSSTNREFIKVTSGVSGKLNNSNFDINSLTSYSLTTCNERGRSRHAICKRRCYRVHGSHRSLLRRRPAVLGQLIAFIASKLAVSTKTVIITSSWHIMDYIISMFFRRRQLKNAQCGPCADWSNTLSTRIVPLEEDTTTVGKLIIILRPIIVQFIADTTILKRWLQALTIKIVEPTVELMNATRNTETIDCWAYEFFFHLKYLQVNRARNDNKVATNDGDVNDNVTHLNLWNQIVQLRDNYIILYEALCVNTKIREIISYCK
ncbi:uncharacterized protein [Chelonus insularis]|uniref:uncharacterized protein n=1 Tax=Chelonus insularis TaxID=460826 RepID=UPI00158947A6|nr:uncharacterized protein LOC118066081 [Chelonus insularis]